MSCRIEKACRLGVHGVVIGSLNTDGTIDTEWTKAMTELAHSHGLQVTFHRAFDHVPDFEAALETLISIGVDRVLTSGGAPTALAGADILSKLVAQAAGRIIIMPGAGIKLRKTLHVYAIKHQRPNSTGHAAGKIRTDLCIPTVAK